MSRTTTFLSSAALIVGFLGGAFAISRAEGTFDWNRFFPLDRTMRIGATTWRGLPGNEGPKITVEADRGPLVSGTFRMKARVKVDTTLSPTLVSMRLMVANDSNSNGVIDSNEWLVVASATPVLLGGQYVAEAPTVTVSAFMAAYRIEHSYADASVSSDDFVPSGLSAP